MTTSRRVPDAQHPVPSARGTSRGRRPRTLAGSKQEALPLGVLLGSRPPDARGHTFQSQSRPCKFLRTKPLRETVSLSSHPNSVLAPPGRRSEEDGAEGVRPPLQSEARLGVHQRGPSARPCGLSFLIETPSHCVDTRTPPELTSVSWAEHSPQLLRCHREKNVSRSPGPATAADDGENAFGWGQPGPGSAAASDQLSAGLPSGWSVK